MKSRGLVRRGDGERRRKRALPPKAKQAAAQEEAGPSSKSLADKSLSEVQACGVGGYSSSLAKEEKLLVALRDLEKRQCTLPPSLRELSLTTNDDEREHGETRYRLSGSTECI